jgi:hypothetical protein
VGCNFEDALLLIILEKKIVPLGVQNSSSRPMYCFFLILKGFDMGLLRGEICDLRALPFSRGKTRGTR